MYSTFNTGNINVFNIYNVTAYGNVFSIYVTGNGNVFTIYYVTGNGNVFTIYNLTFIMYLLTHLYLAKIIV